MAKRYIGENNTENYLLNEIDKTEKGNKIFLLDDAWEYKLLLLKIIYDLSWDKEIVDAVTSNCRDTRNMISNNNIPKNPRIINWLKYKELNSSYNRDIENIRTELDMKAFQDWDNILKKYMKWWELNTVLFNHVIEHIIWDLISDIIKDKSKDMEHIKKIEIRKTNKYDDVFGKTDYVLFVTTHKWVVLSAIDLTTSSNETIIEAKEKEREITTLHDLSTHYRDNKKLKMERRVFPINKNLALELVNNYLLKIKRWEQVYSGDTLKMVKESHKNQLNDFKSIIQEKTAEVLKKQKRRRINQINIDEWIYNWFDFDT